MRHLIVTVAMLCGPAAAAFADVGKEELKKLAQAGLSDELIMDFVRSKGGVAKLSADDVVELKRAGLSDPLLARLIALPEPAKPSDSTPSRIATSKAKLLSDPSVIYDGRYYYPRSYFTSDYTAYCSPSLAFGVAYYYPGWVGSGCRPITWSAGRHGGWGYPGVRAGFGACGSGGPRACHR